VIRGVGKAFKMTSRRKPNIHCYLIYIPSKIVRSEFFPLKHGDRVLIELMPEEECIRITPLRRYIEPSEREEDVERITFKVERRLK